MACLIRGPDGEKIGEVMKAEWKVYRVEHIEGEASAAEKVLSLERFHCCMGHIPSKWLNLLSKTNISLEYTPADHKLFCKSCIYAKARRKLVLNIHKDKRAIEFGGEVHSDLCEKSPVESKGGKLFFFFLEC